jgi:glycine/D-amino acid oxidase-like deaminating enzyme
MTETTATEATTTTATAAATTTTTSTEIAHYDVVIIGGGVVGCALARELSKYQLRVVVLEMYAEIGFGTSKANSGIVHPGHHDKPGTVKVQRFLSSLSTLTLLTTKKGTFSPDLFVFCATGQRRVWWCVVMS